MDTAQSIKTRLASIKSTEAITKSMQLLSTTKAQKTQKRLRENEDFFGAVKESLRFMLTFAQNDKHRYFQPKKADSTVIIVISSDRGLCGGYNVNICKEAYARARENPNPQVIAIGTKARDYMVRRKKKVLHTLRGNSETPFYDDARDIAHMALDLYNKGEADRVLLVYSQYENMLSQSPTTLQLLPLAFAEDEEPVDTRRRLMQLDFGLADVLEMAVPLHTAACIYGGMLSAAACEQSARLTSMDAAVRNCSDMLDKLNLQYNRMRQGKITQELTEIVGGAEALNDDADLF